MPDSFLDGAKVLSRASGWQPINVPFQDSRRALADGRLG
jgi:hypothetical protein